MIKKLNLEYVINGTKILNITDKEFKQFNLLYGYNGSGKTTLSRFFYKLNSGVIDSEYQNIYINNDPDVHKIKAMLPEILVYKIYK